MKRRVFERERVVVRARGEGDERGGWEGKGELGEVTRGGKGREREQRGRATMPDRTVAAVPNQSFTVPERSRDNSLGTPPVRGHAPIQESGLDRGARESCAWLLAWR